MGFWPRWFDSSLQAVCLLSLVLALDYSISLISIQAFWLNAQGSHALLGLVFGSYDLVSIPVAPMLGYIVANWWSYKTLFLVGLAVNMFGNVLFALAGLGPWWWLILAGRVISGLGASVTPVIMAYLSKAVSQERQQDATGYIKYSAVLARVAGPLVSSLLVLTPSAVDLDEVDTTTRLFNVFTWPGWIVTVCGGVTFVLVARNLRNPQQELHALLNTASSSNNDGGSQVAGADGAKPTTLECCGWFGHVWVFQLLTTALYWAVTGNLFSICTVSFRLLHHGGDLWKLYLGGVVGFCIAFAFFMFAKRRLRPISFLRLGIALMLVGQLFLVPFRTHMPAPLFYLGVGFMTMGYGALIPALNAINNVIARRRMEQLGSMTDFYVCVVNAFAAGARFLGPTLFSFVVLLRHRAGSADRCDLDDASAFEYHGCELAHYLPVSLVMVGLTALTLAYSLWYKP